jgi:ribonuclease BN (tRNA processing enzyme)
MTMNVIILGSGTAVPVKGRGYAGIYLRIGKEHVLLDAGPGTLKTLAQLGVTYLDLDRVFLTHFHPDHCLDLVSILFAMRIPTPRRTKPLVIYGPRGLNRLYRQLNEAFHGWIEPRTYRLTLRELGQTRLRFPGYTVRTRSMNHSTPALGYRVEARGKSLVYSGDTDVCDEIIELGREADLLILECSMTDERKVAGHLTPTACGRIAAHANCRHLVLTHFYPVFRGYDIRRRVRRAFSGRLTLARDLARFIV